MDAKITLSFSDDVIKRAKAYAKKNNISLSRLTEFLLEKVTDQDSNNLDDYPISDWVQMVAEGEATYKRRTRSDTKKEYYNSRK